MIPKTKERDNDEYYDRREKDGREELFCYSCGAIVKKTASVCPKCGTLLNWTEFYIGKNNVNDSLVVSIFFSILISIYSVIFIVYALSANQIWYLGVIPIILTFGFTIYFASTNNQTNK